MAEQVKAKRGNVIDAFVDGARNGLKIAFNSMLPNTLFGFTLTIILNLTGLADVIGVVFAPVMRFFGLPGVAATAVMAIFLSMGGAAGVIAGLFTAGQLTEPQVAILLPALLLSGAQIQFMGRLLGTADLKTKYYPHMFVTDTLNGCVAMLIMNYFIV